jgi:hypothetical protein
MGREIPKDLFFGMNHILCAVSENDNNLQGECSQLAMPNFGGTPYITSETISILVG